MLCDNLRNRLNITEKSECFFGPKGKNLQGDDSFSEEAEKRVYSLAMYSCLQLWRFAPEACSVGCSTCKQANTKSRLDGKFCAIPKPPFTPSKTYAKVHEVKKPFNDPDDTENKPSERRQPRKKEKKKNTQNEEENPEEEEPLSVVVSLHMADSSKGRGGGRDADPPLNNQPQNSKKYSIKDSILIEIMCWDPNLRPKK